MNLTNYTKTELQTALSKVSEMLVIQVCNSFNLSNDQLKELKSQIEIELKKRYKVAYLDKIPSAKTKVKREKFKNVY